MAIRVYKAMTNGQRQRSVLTSDEITKTTPEKSLVVTKKKTDGRNNQGKITVRHRGGGVKRKYRLIDFKRVKDGITAIVSSIEYDPNRSANIALITYKDGEKAYIVANICQYGRKVQHIEVLKFQHSAEKSSGFLSLVSKRVTVFTVAMLLAMYRKMKL